MGIVKLSIVMPVYNEAATLRQIVELVQRVDLGAIERELILVDDCSTDGSVQLLGELEGATSVDPQGKPFDHPIRVIRHERNQGKGAALRTGFAQTNGDFVIIQDADLEYDPRDYRKLLDVVRENSARVVYGSRFAGESRNMSFHHRFGNHMLTAVTNLLFGSRLSDMETCYKLFEGPLIRSMEIRSLRFNFEPEITAKILKRGIQIWEVPITYHGREFAAGKKISWRDGFAALWALAKYRFVD